MSEKRHADDGQRVGAEQPVRPAATAILVRDGREGLEVLLVQRSHELVFHGGSWAFPGGRIDEADRAGLADGDEEGAARRAAVREAAEEVGLEVDASTLLPFSHWTTPVGRPRRFAAWFLLGRAPAGEARADGGETVEAAWRTPAAWLAAHAAYELELPPAPWTSLLRLARYADVHDALARSRAHPFVHYAPRQEEVEGGYVSVYREDSCFATPGRLDLPGERHRLWVAERPWRYEAPAWVLEG